MRYFDGRAWGPPPPPVPQFDTKPPHDELPLRAAVGALLVLVLSLLLGGVVVSLVADSDSESPLLLGVSVAFGYGPSLIWCWYVLRRWSDRGMRAVGWSFRWGDLWRGPVTYLAAIGVQIVLAALLLLLDVPIEGNVAPGEGESTLAYKIAIVIVTVVAAPLVEELVFRGIVLRGLLSTMRAVPAIAIQGVLFGVAHVDPSRGSGNIGLAIVLSGVGIAFCTSAYLTRRIWPTIIAHAIFNGVVMILLLSGAIDDLRDDFDATAGSEPAVVDQAHIAEPDGGQHHGWTVDLGDRFQGGGVDDLDVLDASALFAG
jgi:membrane protease YdiL (CAAX protease family)